MGYKLRPSLAVQQSEGRRFIHPLTYPMDFSFADALLFLIPAATFVALLYFLSRFLVRQGRRQNGEEDR